MAGPLRSVGSANFRTGGQSPVVMDLPPHPTVNEGNHQMKRIALLAAVAAGLLSGCAMTTRAPVTGFVYNSTKANGGEGFSESVETQKTGRACATSILGIVGTGDASIQEAARNGGISKISFVDTENKMILGIWAESCTVVYGQ